MARDGFLLAVDRYRQRLANLAHPHKAERSDSFDQHSKRNRFDRVQIHGAATADLILRWFEDNLAR